MLNGMGTSADTFPASVYPNEYAHGEVGMYSGTSSLVGLGNAKLKNMTVGEVLEQAPMFIEMFMKNPKAAKKLFSAFSGTGLGSVNSVISANENMSYQEIDNRTGFAKGYVDISQPDPEQPAVRVDVDVIKPVTGQFHPSIKTITFAFKTAAKMINKAGNYTRNGVQYEQARMDIEVLAMGRNPEYKMVHTTLTSANQPPQMMTFRLIDATRLEDNGIIMTASQSATPSDMEAHEFMNEVYLSYHETENDFLDRLYYDRKYGWIA